MIRVGGVKKRLTLQLFQRLLVQLMMVMMIATVVQHGRGAVVMLAGGRGSAPVHVVIEVMLHGALEVIGRVLQGGHRNRVDPVMVLTADEVLEAEVGGGGAADPGELEAATDPATPLHAVVGQRRDWVVWSPFLGSDYGILDQLTNQTTSTVRIGAQLSLKKKTTKTRKRNLSYIVFCHVISTPKLNRRLNSTISSFFCV